MAYVLLDLTLTTLLYVHGSRFGLLKEEALHFNVLSSLLDLWGAALLRAAPLLGACAGVLRNGEEGPRRVARLGPAVVLLCLTVVAYAAAKLLLLSERRPLAQQPWALGLLCWTLASCLGLPLLWKLLGKVAQPAGERRSSRRRGSEDTEGLVNSVEEEEEEGRHDSGATLGRLLAYSRRDAGLLSVAGLFLLISAVCKCDECKRPSRFAGDPAGIGSICLGFYRKAKVGGSLVDVIKSPIKSRGLNCKRRRRLD